MILAPSSMTSPCAPKPLCSAKTYVGVVTQPSQPSQQSTQTSDSHPKRPQMGTTLEAACPIKRRLAVVMKAGSIHEIKSQTWGSGDWRDTAYIYLGGSSVCGTERWPVKTLSDPDAAHLHNAGTTTIAALVSIPSLVAHSMHEVHLYNDKRFPQEEKIVTVQALVLGTEVRSDHDYHIVIASPQDLDVTMIAEIPDPTCGIPVKYRAKITEARAYFSSHFEKPTTHYKQLPSPAAATITGVIFEDLVHGANGGQIGHAPNGIEIHPVLSIVRN